MFPKCELPSEPKFLEIDAVDRVFPTPQGPYVALKGIDLTIEPGEFICAIGHSGCGKSTLLNIVAGLDRASAGGVVLEGKEVREPGPERMVVFQNHSLLPWLTVRQNIALGVNRVFAHLPKSERRQIVEEHIDLVHLRHAADKYPRELSGGMKQRVGIARALALRPKLLLLDEPFGALDALTRGRLQEQLMEICNHHRISALMVTHDVDEALLLSDRIVMLTNGPAARIGQILKVDLPRPRERLTVVNHPAYYRMRGELVEFLNRQKARKQLQLARAKGLTRQRENLEKTTLDVGFIPLTDCAPLAIALEKGFFAAQGLDVNLVRSPSWGAIAEDLREGNLDGAVVVTGMPLALTLGMGEQKPVPMVTALTLNRNGNAITLDRTLWEQGIRTPLALAAYLRQHHPALGMVHPASMHNLLLRRWLLSLGVHPDLDVRLEVVPPPQMVANLSAGNLLGYCVGEPWNSRAVAAGIGWVAASDRDIWPGHPEKVLTVRQDWATAHPHTHRALVQALLQACQFCQASENREEVLQILCRPAYLNADPVWVRPGLAGPFRIGTGEEWYTKDFHIFFGDNAPQRREQLWVLTEMVRWGLVSRPEEPERVLGRLLATEVFEAAAAELELTVPPEPETPIVLGDGTVFDPQHPWAQASPTA